jgi:hypothetical protein
MLKKELSMHQRRAAEALALQREQTQRMASNLSAEVSRLSQSGSEDAEDDGDNSLEMERILSAIPPPPPPPPKATQADKSTGPPEVVVPLSTIPRSPRADGSPGRDLFSDTEEDDTVADTIIQNASSVSQTNDESAADKKDEPPKVFSTPNRNRSADRWIPKMDAPGRGSMGESPRLFPHSASPKVVSVRHANYNEEMPADMISPPHRTNHPNLTETISDPDDDDTVGSASTRGVASVASSTSPSAPSQSSIQRRGIIGMNSIDAFEASFDTSFPPAVFEDSDAERQERTTPTSTEIYNPFAPSPVRLSQMQDTQVVRSPISEKATQSSLPPKSNMPIVSTPEVIRKARASDATPFGNPSTPEEKKSDDHHPWSQDVQYHTPPKEILNDGTSPLLEPSRPHKTVSTEARARYEKAIQPRTSPTESAPKLVVEAKQESSNQHKATRMLKGSPSSLLRRIHQRRINKQMTRQQSAPESVPNSNDNKEIARPKAEMNRQKSAPETLTHFSGEIPCSNISSYPEVVLRTTIHSTFSLPTARDLPIRELPARSDSERSSTGSERPFDEVEEGLFSSSELLMEQGQQSKSARLSAIKNHRRSVKQPVSYAEPALNTKLRQGDTFFQKTDVQPQIVTPEQVSQHAG